jgi:hypothetical protein
MPVRAPQPPKTARWLLGKFLRSELKEEVYGDLDEKFEKDIAQRSLRAARLHYWYQTFHYLRPFAITTPGDTSPNPLAMFHNYFKVALRNLTRNLGYSMINIGGLAAGLTVAMLIGLWVYDEITFNDYHTNKSTIAQVMRQGTTSTEIITTQYLPYALAEELEDKFGGTFKHILPTSTLEEYTLAVGETILSCSGSFIGAGAPDAFSLRMIKGTHSALNERHSIILSESAAKIFFGNKEAMGQSMRMGNSFDVTVSGIFEDLPHNSEFAGSQFFAPWDLLLSGNPWMTTQGFGNNFLTIYVELQPGITPEIGTDRIHDIILDHVRDNKEYVSVNPQIFLHPMDKWHLHGEFRNGQNEGGLIRFVWMFGTAGVFVLLLACINFMNLSTSRSERRGREVGIRKAMGSVRSQLINQFLSESILVVVISFFIALIVAALSLGWFNQLAGKQISMPWSNIYFWIAAVAFILFTGIIAGSYPAFYLSSFQPVKILKGVFRAGSAAVTPRKVLVVIQFTVSVVLVIGTLIVYQQVQFAKNRPVGYDRSGLVSVRINSIDRSQLQVIENELMQTGVVEMTAFSQSPLTSIWSSNGGFEWRDKDADLRMDFATLSVSHNYGKTVGWEFTDGRDFSEDLASDSSGFVITEEAARIMNLGEPVGEEVNWAPGWRPAKKFHIIGVIKNMVMRSPYTHPMPTVFFIDTRDNWFNIRLSGAATPSESIQKIESIFKKLVPLAPFEYNFADEAYNIKFQAEERIGKLTGVFAVLAVLISCLGLFGLASFTAEQRTREIGIRKVMGASIWGLWKLISKDFIVLVTIASVIAIPIGWYIVLQWLENYTYRTPIRWWIFALAIGGAVLVTLITVSYQSIKAALANPVKSLRTE